MFALEDIVYGLLGQGRGHSVNRMYRCEFHDDRTASLSVNLDSGLWQCFGCGRKGNIEGLAKALGETLDGDVRLRLAQRQAEATENYTPAPLFDDKASRAVRALDDDQWGLWVHWCISRGIDPRSASPYKIGWSAEKGAFTFPYMNTEGRCIGLKYRDLRGHKWSEPESRFEFFGPSIVGRGEVIVCEGESDTLRTYTEVRASGDNIGVVGTSGANLLDTHWQALALQLLFARRVWLLYDADDAGDKCAENGMRVLGDKATRIRPTRGKDITEHLMNGGTLDGIGLGTAALHV